jgi:hypothetical protein
MPLCWYFESRARRDVGLAHMTLMGGGRRGSRQLLRGDQIKAVSNHHVGVAAILGQRPAGMDVSRTCPDDCPERWVGYSYRSGKRIPYRLCTPAHYIYETRAENLSRKAAELPVVLRS